MNVIENGDRNGCVHAGGSKVDAVWETDGRHADRTRK